MRLIKSIKSSILLYKLIKLSTDKKLTKNQIKIFDQFLNSEKHNSGNTKIFNNYRYRDLIGFSITKAIICFAVGVINSEKVKTRTVLDREKLRSIIENQPFSDYLFDNINKKWSNEVWYSNNKLPIIMSDGKFDYVVDGNHRLVQQIKQNKVKYIYVKTKLRL